MNKVESGGVPSGNLFNDIYLAFVDSGLDVNKAKEFTWNVIGVISTGGPNYGNRASMFGENYENPIAKVGLAMIASSLPILDLRSRSSGHPYSYPPTVTTHCDNGKPYFFWMSAYLAYQLTKESNDPVAATSAVYTTTKGYQMLSQAGFRNPERAFQVDSFDGFNNVIRMDLTYSAAGVRYGADSAATGKKTSSLNIDEGIHKIVSQSSVTPNLSSEEARNLLADKKSAYLKWSQRFAPDSVYKFFNP